MGLDDGVGDWSIDPKCDGVKDYGRESQRVVAAAVVVIPLLACYIIERKVCEMSKIIQVQMMMI